MGHLLSAHILGQDLKIGSVWNLLCNQGCIRKQIKLSSLRLVWNDLINIEKVTDQLKNPCLSSHTRMKKYIFTAATHYSVAVVCPSTEFNPPPTSRVWDVVPLYPLAEFVRESS